jgi:hypothetical protein
MKPADLKAEHFAGYRTVARQTAIEYLATLQQLPGSFLPFLLKEMIALDWKFPAEREELVQQLSYLQSLAAAERNREMEAFARIHMPPELEALDWVNMPGQFLEKFSAQLWATSQMDGFRLASERYMQNFRAARPNADPPIPRLAIVLIGRGVASNSYPLFRKLRRQGTYFKEVNGSLGLDHVVQLINARAASRPAPYAHWFIDGDRTTLENPQVAFISYEALSPIRASLTAKIRQAFESRMSPEALRTMLAETTPDDLGIRSKPGEVVLDHFKVALFTEGSGTQIYSTTFVQWTAREALRRARPLTLVARFTPRQREAPMSELLNGTFKNTTDPAGSLVDADMGAWYTWIGLQRLPGSDRSAFLAWFEDHNEAVAVGPAFAKSGEDNTPIQLAELLQKVSSGSSVARG